MTILIAAPSLALASSLMARSSRRRTVERIEKHGKARGRDLARRRPARLRLRAAVRPPPTDQLRAQMEGRAAAEQLHLDVRLQRRHRKWRACQRRDRRGGHLRLLSREPAELDGEVDGVSSRPDALES